MRLLILLFLNTDDILYDFLSSKMTTNQINKTFLSLLFDLLLMMRCKCKLWPRRTPQNDRNSWTSLGDDGGEVWG